MASQRSKYACSVRGLAVLLFLQVYLILEVRSSENKILNGCQEKSTCSGNINEFSFHRSCQCDEQCPKFGDCCQDSQYYHSSKLSDCVEVGKWNILGAAFVDSYYMVKTCPSTWTEEETLNKCQNYLETVEVEPILGQPITSKGSNITYVNYHCAKCNSDLEMFTVIRWKLAVSCNKQASRPFPNIDAVLNVSTIVDGKWIKPKFNLTHHTCKLFVWRPLKLLRRCHKSIIQSCPDSWKNETVRNLCETQTSIVYYMKQRPYRNQYCAKCHKVNEKFLSCAKDFVSPEGGFLGTMESPDDSVSEICNSKEEYDPSARQCRDIIASMFENNETSEYDDCLNRSCKVNNNTNNFTNDILDTDDFVLSDNSTVNDFSGKTYNNGEFRLNGEGRVEISSANDIETSVVFGNSAGYVTLFGIGISVTGLLALILTN